MGSFADAAAALESKVDKTSTDLIALEARVAALEAGAPVDPPDVEQPPVGEDDTLQELVDRGGTVELPKAAYAECATVNVPVVVCGAPTTIDVSGEHLTNGKAIFDAQASCELRDLTLRGASVESNNGCAIRGGPDASIKLQNCTISGNEMGLLMMGGHGAVLEITDCEIRENGLSTGGLGHEIYCNAEPRAQWGECNLVVTNSEIIGGARTCIALKSRATNTTVKNCALRGSTSSDPSVAGRVVDIPDGGEVLIEDTLIELQASSPTASLLGFCTESTAQGVGTVTLRNVIVSDQRNRGGEFWCRSGVGGKLVLESCTYTASNPPSLYGWDSVVGQFTKA